MADCFYIVESGEVKIMIKSKVSTVSEFADVHQQVDVICVI